MELSDFRVPSPDVFTAVQSASIKKLVSLSEIELRPILPSLVRTSVRSSLDISDQFKVFQREIQKKISDISSVNSIVLLLSVDFNLVHEDAIKEQHLRHKLGDITLTDELLSESSQKGLLLEFEESDPIKRIRLVLSEVLRISTAVQSQQGSFCIDDTELFECHVYFEEISDVLCIVFSEIQFLLPAPEVCEALLRVKFGPWLICRLVANNPDCFDVVCSSILSHATSSDELDVETQIRTKTLKMLCAMNPQYRKILRAECVSLCKLAGLAVELSVTTSRSDSISDIVSFFTGLLLASDSRTKEWLAEYVKAAQKEHKDNALSAFKKQLIKEMGNVIQTFRSNVKTEEFEMDISTVLNNHIMHGIAIMRLYCALKSMSGFKLTNQESEVLLDLMMCQAPASTVGMRFVVVSICTLVVCSFLLSTQDREEKVTTWLKDLIEHSSTNETNASYGETLLLIAIHFHGHSLEPIIDLVCSTLGIKLRPSSLTKIKILFTQQVFPEKVVAEHALTVPVTKGLNKNVKGFLPVHCVHQLTKSRVFTKHCISVKDWIYKQMCACKAPVHPLMRSLIETYINSIIMPLNISKSKQEKVSSLMPFREEDLLKVFQNKIPHCGDVTTTHLLFLLYALTYQNALLSNMKTLINNPKRPREYSTVLYTIMPMKQLLLRARADEESFGDLYPPLLRLLTSLYPHLCLVEDWIEEEETIGDMNIRNANNETILDVEQLKKDLENLQHCPQKPILTLSKLTLLHPNRLMLYVDVIIDLLPKLLDVVVGRKLQLLVAKIWMKINTVAPRILWLKTVNVLRKQPDSETHEWNKTQQYTDEEIQKDPLIVLRCDPKVYRCPHVFDIILRTLNGYLSASRALLNHHLLSNPLSTNSKLPLVGMAAAEQEREELKVALISAQESAALQILLEVCLPTDMERKMATYDSRSTLREIQCKVCSFIHQSFISEPNMAKLIHFQAYPAELLAVTVAGVPSIHICIHFIPELLNQPHLEKQLFAVQLISHLALQYPIPKSFSMCKYVITRMNDLLVALPVAKRNQFFFSALKCLTRICKAFPPLCEEATELLLKVGKVATSQLSKTSFTAVPSLKLKDTSNEDDGGMEDDGMEVDSCHGDSSQIIKTNTRLDGDNPALSSSTFVKLCTSKQLVEETENIYQQIISLTLSGKLASCDGDETAS